MTQQAGSIDSPEALVAGAVAIARHRLADADHRLTAAALQAYADKVLSRVRSGRPKALLAHLHDILFEEGGFRGNTADYYAIDNSLLPAALATRRGLPIILSLIYKSVADRVGLRAWGLALPGHFMAGVEVEGDVLIIDPFHGGRELSRDEAHDHIRRVLGEEIEWTDDYLLPASHRQWLTRIIQNLLNGFAAAEQFNDVAAMLELEMLLWPEEERLKRDLALVLARCGLSVPASQWLDRYLRDNPDDPQRGDLQQLLGVLGG